MPIQEALAVMRVIEILMQIRTTLFMVNALLALLLALELGLLLVGLRRQREMGRRGFDRARETD